MPATPARIAFVTQEVRTVVSSDAAIKARYGTAARDTGDEIVETFFDTAADIQAMDDERFALLKADRRKFNVDIAGIVDFSGALAFTSNLPAVTLIDDEKLVNQALALVAIPAIDYEKNTTSVTLWG